MVKALHEWLSKESSTLRGLFSFLAAGGVYYTSSCAEKTARAYVNHGGGSLPVFQGIAKARLVVKDGSKPTKGPDDTSCLFG